MPLYAQFNLAFKKKTGVVESTKAFIGRAQEHVI